MNKRLTLMFVVAALITVLASWGKIRLRFDINLVNERILRFLDLGVQSADILERPMRIGDRLDIAVENGNWLNQRLHNLQPLLITDERTLQLRYSEVPLQTVKGWRLTAYGFDELAMRRSASDVTAAFQWQTSEQGEARGQWNDWNWSLNGTDFVITGTVDSLIRNGGFELPLTDAPLPSGFRDSAGHRENPEEFYAQHFNLREEERNGRRSKTLTLSAGQEVVVSVLTAGWLPISGGNCYLHGAWTRGSGGNLGLIWYDQDGTRLCKIDTMRGVESQKWVHVSGVACAPHDAAWAAAFIRTNGPGSVSHFDDVFLFLLPWLPSVSELVGSN